MMNNSGCGQAVTQRIEVMSGDVLVGNDDSLAAAHQRCDLGARPFDQPRPDEDIVGAVAQIDMQLFDCVRHSQYSSLGGVCAEGQAASAARTRVTVASGDPSLLSTTISASAYTGWRRSISSARIARGSPDFNNGLLLRRE